MNIRTNQLILFIYSAILVLSLILYNFNNFNLTENLITFILFAVSLITMLFYLRDEKVEPLKGQFLKHSNFAIFGLLVVGFQSYLDYYLGYIDQSDLLMQVSEAAAAKSIVLAFIGLIAFYIGYIYKSIKKVKHKNCLKLKYVSTWLLSFFSGVLLCLYLYNVNPLYIYGGYGIYDMGDFATYISYLFRATYFALTIQIIINIKNTNISNISNISIFNYLKIFGWINLIIILIYLISVLLSGDRGDLISFPLLIILGYIYVSNYKIKFLKGIFMILVASVVITTLGVARSFNIDEDLSFYVKIQKAIQGESNKQEMSSILPFTTELASSVKALHYSVENVPSNYNYLYGRFQTQALLGVFPFSGLISPYLFNDTSSKYNSSDSFITWLIEGDNPLSGQGTSILADFYLSFGALGLTVGMVFYGWLIRYCELQLAFKETQSLIAIIITIVIFCYCFYLARSSLFSFIRLIVWIWILIRANEWINHQFRRLN